MTHFQGLRAVALVGAAAMLTGCSSDSEGTPPPKTAAEELCDALVAYVASCGPATPCDKALAGDCADVAGMLGDPFLRAMKQCLEGGGDPASCVLSSASGLTPTAAQEHFAEEFCGNCALGLPGCKEALFGGENTELAPVAALIAPLSDALVDEITAECTGGPTCLATFVNCVEGVLAKRALPEKTLTCVLEDIAGTNPVVATGCPDGSGGAGATGGQGGSGPGGAGGQGTGGNPVGTGGTGGTGGGTVCTDSNEPNDTFLTPTLLDAADNNELSECEPDQIIGGSLDGPADLDWFAFEGLDSICLDELQPHASVRGGEAVKVCVYLKPIDAASQPPTCMVGATSDLGNGYTGCCGDGSTRLKYGTNLQNDSAHVRIVLSTSIAACVDYSMTHGFGVGP